MCRWQDYDFWRHGRYSIETKKKKSGLQRLNTLAEWCSMYEPREGENLLVWKYHKISWNITETSWNVQAKHFNSILNRAFSGFFGLETFASKGQEQAEQAQKSMYQTVHGCMVRIYHPPWLIGLLCRWCSSPRQQDEAGSASWQVVMVSLPVRWSPWQIHDGPFIICDDDSWWYSI